MPLFKKDQAFPERSVLVIIVGTPFSYKTSLSITANQPILFDFEKGSERAHGRAETYRIDSSWKEVEDDLAQGLLAPFKSVVIDTGGALIDDYLWDYGLSIKYTKNSMQNWGTVKELFKKFVSKVRGSGLDLVVISHEKSKDKNDETVYDLDMSGGGKQLLLRQADQIGFISKKDFKEGPNVITKTILTFWPTANLPFLKNVASLPDIILPDCKAKEWEGFLDRTVIQPTRRAILEMSAEQAEAVKYVEEWQTAIDAIVVDENASEEVVGKQLIETLQEIAKIEKEHIKLQVRAYFTGHLKSIGFSWVKEPAPGAFKSVVVKDAASAAVNTAKPEKVAEKPKGAVEKAKEPVTGESNPAGLTSPKGEEAADAVERDLNNHDDDLFAPTGGEE